MKNPFEFLVHHQEEATPTPEPEIEATEKVVSLDESQTCALRRPSVVDGRKVHKRLQVGVALVAAVSAMLPGQNVEAQPPVEQSRAERMQKAAPGVVNWYFDHVKSGKISTKRTEPGLPPYMARGRTAVYSMALSLLSKVDSPKSVTLEQVQEAVDALVVAYRMHLVEVAARKYPKLEKREGLERLVADLAHPGEDAEERALELFGTGAEELQSLEPEGLLYIAYMAAKHDELTPTSAGVKPQ